MTRLVVWDWNGTLLDDVHMSVKAMNRLLRARRLDPMTLDRYYEVFTFPVRTYYETMGFDFSAESFDDVAQEYHVAYDAVVAGAPLRPDALEVLTRVRACGATQVILSALEESRLERELNRRGIRGWFDAVYGLGNLHAESKSARARELAADFPVDAGQGWMVGDTVHDAEVALECGLRPIAIEGGHQSRSRLAEDGVPVVASLSEALDLMGLNREGEL